MTKLELANKFFFQFFFTRLTKWVKEGKIKAWGLIYPIVPFTGWRSNYIVLTKSGKFKSVIFKKIDETQGNQSATTSR